MSRATSAVVDLHGVQLDVHRRGDGPAVVFVHGEDGLLFSAPVLGALAHHATVYAPVLPGWGDLARPSWCTSIADLAIVLLDLVESLDTPVILVGVSLGAWVVAEALVRDQHRVRAAVLVSPVGIKVRGRTDRDYLDLFAEPAAVVERAMHAGAPPIDRAYLADIEYAELARAQDAVARYAWQPYFHDPKLRGRLARVRVPVTIVHGALDSFVSNAAEFYGAYAAAFATPARVVAVDGAAHRVDEEHPERVAAEVHRIIAATEATA